MAASRPSLMKGAILVSSLAILLRKAGKLSTQGFLAAQAFLALIFLLAIGVVSAFMALPAAAAEPTGVPARPVVVGAKLEQTASGTRLILISSQPLSATPFALEKPDRLVLDLPEVNFQLPAHTGESGTGLVKSFRFGLFGFGRSRIVIDLSAPAHVASVVNTPLLKELGTTVTIELDRIDREVFHDLAAVSHAVPALAAAANPAEPSRPAAAPKDMRPLVVIDPGHGGFDPGAMGGNGEVEKTITLEFATT